MIANYKLLKIAPLLTISHGGHHFLNSASISDVHTLVNPKPRSSELRVSRFGVEGKTLNPKP